MNDIALQRPVAASSTGSDLQSERLKSAWLFLAPTFLVLALVAGWPLVRTVWFSLTDASLTNLEGAQFVGLKNYLTWITLSSGRTIYRGLLADPAWWGAVLNTLKFTVVSVSLETILGLIVALVLNAEFKGRGLVRAAILVPWAIPTIVSAQMWAWMLNDQFGILNDLFLNLGDLQQDRLDRQSGNRDGRRLDCRHLEDNALHGAAHSRRPANGAEGHVRGSQGGWHSSGQGVLPRHPADDPTRAHGRRHLPHAGCDARLRPHLHPDTE